MKNRGKMMHMIFVCETLRGLKGNMITVFLIFIRHFLLVVG